MKPDSLAQQAFVKDQERKAESALEEVLRKNPDLRATCRKHRWFVEQIDRIESAELAAERARRG